MVTVKQIKERLEEIYHEEFKRYERELSRGGMSFISQLSLGAVEAYRHAIEEIEEMELDKKK